MLRWVKNASKERGGRFDELTPDLYDRLMAKLEDWAKPKETKAELAEPETAETEAG